MVYVWVDDWTGGLELNFGLNKISGRSSSLDTRSRILGRTLVPAQSHVAWAASLGPPEEGEQSGGGPQLVVLKM